MKQDYQKGKMTQREQEIQNLNIDKDLGKTTLLFPKQKITQAVIAKRIKNGEW